MRSANTYGRRPRGVLAQWPHLTAILLTPVLAACSDVQSIMAPQSLEAERTKQLADILFVGGTVILMVVVGLIAAALFGTPAIRARLARASTVFIGGIVFPAVTLTTLLVYGLSIIGNGFPASAKPIEIDVQGERWWWRVNYTDSTGQKIASANEIRVPVDRPVRLRLTTADVIYSFWVPRLAGKVDMIPGRINFVEFQAVAVGEFRGQCAEYCGGAHALMGTRIIALKREKFEAWLRNERQPAKEPSQAIEKRGRELFLQRGCGACHTISGIGAVGTSGPNLTHVANRKAIAAETLPMTTENLVRWIADNEHVKPNNLMPSYGALPEPELQAIARYLFSLE